MVSRSAMNLFAKHLESAKASNSPYPTPLNAPENQPEQPKGESPVMEIARFVVLALLIVMPIRWFIAQPFIVSGASMEDTFYNNEYLIVDQLTYRFEEPKRGDVVIFRYPRDPSTFFIKRVIGLPGETISIEGKTVIIQNDEYPGGVAINEPYISDMEEETFLTQTLRDGEYFVMGDNRDHSSDSRKWGSLKEEEIVGRALLRLFPLTRADILPGEYDADQSLVPVVSN